MSLVVREILEIGQRQLEESHISDAKLDAKLLYCHLMNITTTQLILEYQRPLPDHLCDEYFALLDRRSSGEPLQYITGTQEFMGLEFHVNENVLIPRQDTEILVETALSFMKPEDRVLDMCTGSGCILLSLAALGNMRAGTGADISSEALAVADRNRQRHHLDQIELIQSDLFENVSGHYDMILSNPPYIPTAEIDGLMREVRDHEPHLALDGSRDGLAFYRRIARQAGDYLVHDGMLLLEIGWNQAEEVCALLEEAGFREIRVKQDLAGLDRVVYALK